MLPNIVGRMSLDEQLLKILVCPRDKTPLRAAEEALLARANEAIAAKQLKKQDGELCTDTIAHGLLNGDGSLLYRVQDGVPVLLVDEAIPTEQLGS